MPNLLFFLTQIAQGGTTNFDAQPAPVLLEPLDTAVLIIDPPTFSWESVFLATGYEIEVALDEAFTLLVEHVTDQAETEFTPANPLHRPILTAPEDGLIEPTDFTPTFEWDGIIGTLAYTWVMALDAALTMPLVSQPIIDATTYTPDEDLPTGALYWGVSADLGAFSISRALTLLAAPTLMYPEDEDSITDTTPYMLWNGVAGADSYQLQISTNVGFTEIVVDEIVSNTEYETTELALDTYYWRVLAVAGEVNSAWSSTFTFDITA